MPPSISDFMASEQPSALVSFFALLIGAPICYVALNAIYNIYFHPLHSIPGPKLNAMSNIPFARMVLNGNPSKTIFDMHRKYGDMVRIAPNDVAFSSAKAWNDIMGHRKAGQLEMGKNPESYPPADYGAQSLLVSDREHHARFRRVLSRPFSDKAMREQEPLIGGYVNLLIQRLHEHSDKPIDMVSWYNFTTFDVIGDLTFGESFGCLKNSEYHPWISLVLGRVKATAYMVSSRRFPLIQKFLMKLVPARIKQQHADHRAMTIEKVNKRLATETDRPDFITPILAQSDEKGMTRKEIQANASTLIIAGSETTATALSGVTYFLLKNPNMLAKLKEEVRSTFQRDEDITFASVARLPYLLACLDETLRLYPPVSYGLARRTPPGGDRICGKFIAGGTSVSMWQWAINRLPEHFTDPEEYHPERSLGDPRYASDHREVIQPFHTGPRNCIGKNLAIAEMRLILAKVIFHFDMSLQPDSEDWINHELYMLWMKPPLNVVLTPVERN